MKTFVDKNQIREVFGQETGKYHGFKEDYIDGGTYNPNPRNKMFVDDISSYTRFKLRNKSVEPRAPKMRVSK